MYKKQHKHCNAGVVDGGETSLICKGSKRGRSCAPV